MASPARDARPRLLVRGLLTALSAAAVAAAGWLLGRVLMSTRWTQAITIVGLGAAGFLLLLAPQTGLLAWILLAPYAPHIYLTMDFGSGIPNLDLGRLATLFLLYLLIARSIFQPRGDSAAGQPRRLGWTEALMAAFTAGMLLSVLSGAGGLLAGVQYVFDFVAMPCLVYIFARRWLRDARGLAALVGMLALAGLVMGLITAREQLTGQAVFSPVPFALDYETKSRKVMSLFGHPSTISMALAVSAPVLVYGIRRAASAGARLLLGLALIVTLAGVFFAYMRAGWLGAVLGLVIVAVLSPRLRRTLLPLLPLLVIAGVIISATLLAPGAVEERLSSEQPITYRLEAWRISGEILQTSPLTGIGFGQFGNVVQQEYLLRLGTRAVDQPTPHNTYLDIFLAGGLLAFLPFAGLLISLFLRGLRAWRQRTGRDLVSVLWATLAAYAVIIGTFDALSAQYANLVFFLICGALLGRLEAVETGAAAGAAAGAEADA